MNPPLVVLGIIDGFGYSPQTAGNAIYQASTPNLDYLWTHFPHFLLKAAEEEVGLAFGEIGNSEVGHITIGTGRVVPQSLSRINKTIDDQSFFDNPAFLRAIQNVKTHNSHLHLLGIISTAGVHGHLNHFLALIQLAARHSLKQIYLHLILDGRDAGPRDSPLFLREIDNAINQYSLGTYASICGRALAMDRNNNWERTQKAYEVLMGKSEYRFPNPHSAINYFYQQNIDDENLPPVVITTPDGNTLSIQNYDSIIISNFREDRARQITRALSLPAFNKFPRTQHPQQLHISTMTSYEKALPVDVAFPTPPIYNTLSDVISNNHLSQIHIAETEKYAHVTYFFNGGRESKVNQEEYFLVPSLKPDEFEHNPQMSASLVTQSVLQSINLGYQFIIFNFANCDMVGHTGNFKSTITAVEIVDQQMSQIWSAINQRQGFLILTADHGNAEQMINPKTNAIYKEHTISSVPLIIAHQSLFQSSTETIKITTNSTIAGLLSDIAPTILSIYGFDIPSEMTGTSLYTPNQISFSS